MSNTRLRVLCFALAAVVACEHGGGVGPPAESTLIVTADLTGTAVATVVVEVTAPDIPSQWFNIPIVDNVASGTIILRAGSGRTITMRAYDAGGVETHRGSATLNIRPGTNSTISIVLQPLTGDVQIDVTLGSFSVTVTPGASSLMVGEIVTLTATIRDANGNLLAGQVGWATLDPGVATVVSTGQQTGRMTAIGVGTATVMATFAGQAGTATVTAIMTGLDFPGNVAVTTTMRFEFTSPFAAYPATYIWRAYPREQAGYYTSFFHANNNSFFNNQLEYYGFHPYPEPPPPLVGIQKWEISVDGGNDITGDPVVFNRWYLQVAVVSKDGSATHHTYYWDWPDTTTHKIRRTGALYAAAPNPAIMVGDNPWNPGEEVYDGVLRGFQFYDVALTPSEIAQEIAAPGSVRQPWYLNLNPTPTDISDKSGNGHHPAWVGTERAALWKDTGP